MTLSQLLFSSIVDDDKSSTGPSPLLLEIDDDDIRGDDDDEGDENNNDDGSTPLLLLVTGANNRGVVVVGGGGVTKALQLQHEKIGNSAAATAEASRRRPVLRLADIAGMLINYYDSHSSAWIHPIVAGCWIGAAGRRLHPRVRDATRHVLVAWLYPVSRHFRLNRLPAVFATESLPRVGTNCTTSSSLDNRHSDPRCFDIYLTFPPKRSMDKGCVFVKGYYELKCSCRLRAEIRNFKLLFQKSDKQKNLPLQRLKVGSVRHLDNI